MTQMLVPLTMTHIAVRVQEHDVRAVGRETREAIRRGTTHAPFSPSLRGLTSAFL